MGRAGRRAAPSYSTLEACILQKADAYYYVLQIFTNMKLA
jgi:hypothetical protein